MNPKTAFDRAGPGIATRAELDQRLAARPKPRAERHLTIDGSISTAVHSDLNQQAEARIAYLKERLDTADSKMRLARLRAGTKDRARSAFDRSR